MPLYEFHCQDCGPIERHHPMATVPDDEPCPECGESMRRRVGAPALGRIGSPAMRALDDAARSAHEPAVVNSLPGSPRTRRTPRSADPRHRKLPRP
ncbi:FmdB family zinc ribbon protein [Rhodococcus rhodnii]|uniref:Putative regulatory protein FmdB zinc ribbon domain-containing protein n=1 Tax=Rhodococcus rhodnii LMG 5362 TaxID=1273125 RepID=R7WN19_9NOCA|nr:zinc ribbon domain-containing protein [Rhodococcus rhodnii]EOM76690.1 hypothetical protein Rrhod_1967 [Rhodococcus rhodnii LMG 5362]